MATARSEAVSLISHLPASHSKSPDLTCGGVSLPVHQEGPLNGLLELCSACFEIQSPSLVPSCHRRTLSGFQREAKIAVFEVALCREGRGQAAINSGCQVLWAGGLLSKQLADTDRKNPHPFPFPALAHSSSSFFSLILLFFFLKGGFLPSLKETLSLKDPQSSANDECLISCSDE